MSESPAARSLGLAVSSPGSAFMRMRGPPCRTAAQFNKGAGANRCPVGQSNGSGEFQRDSSSHRAFPAGFAELVSRKSGALCQTLENCSPSSRNCQKLTCLRPKIHLPRLI